MQAITPYLNFDGTAAEALDFYANALGGQIVHKQTYGESQDQFPCADGDKDKIMHALFNAGDLNLMASDCPSNMTPDSGSTISLALNFTDEESITNTFNALSEGGNVTMPLQDTFWGAKFGMATDKFGVNWMFNYDKPKA